MYDHLGLGLYLPPPQWDNGRPGHRSPKPRSIGPEILVCNLMKRGKSVDPGLDVLDGCGKLCITSPYDLLGAPNWADGRDEWDLGERGVGII